MSSVDSTVDLNDLVTTAEVPSTVLGDFNDMSTTLEVPPTTPEYLMPEIDAVPPTTPGDLNDIPTIDAVPPTTPGDLNDMPAIDAVPHTIEGDLNDIPTIELIEVVPRKLRVKRRRKKTDSSSVWNCLLCYKHFSNKYCLQTHTKKCIGIVENAPVPVNDNIGYEIMSFLWKCSHCDKRFSDKRCLQRHNKKCTGNVEKAPISVDIEYEMSSVWKCQHCHRRFRDKRRLQKHNKKLHSNVTVDVMSEPATGSSTIRRVKQNRRKPDPSSEWKCLHCNKHFIAKGCLKKHKRKMHSAEELLAETAAEGVSSTMRVKPSRKKTESSAWKCLQCDRHYSDQYCLEKHSKKCVGKVVKAPVGGVNIGECSSSNITSLHSSNGISSTTRVRKGQSRRHSCLICEKSFANKQDLVYHIKSYHPSIDADAICPPRFKKVLQCPGELLRLLK